MQKIFVYNLSFHTIFYLIVLLPSSPVLCTLFLSRMKNPYVYKQMPLEPLNFQEMYVTVATDYPDEDTKDYDPETLQPTNTAEVQLLTRLQDHSITKVQDGNGESFNKPTFSVLTATPSNYLLDGYPAFDYWPKFTFETLTTYQTEVDTKSLPFLTTIGTWRNNFPDESGLVDKYLRKVASRNVTFVSTKSLRWTTGLPKFWTWFAMTHSSHKPTYEYKWLSHETPSDGMDWKNVTLHSSNKNQSDVYTNDEKYTTVVLVDDKKNLSTYFPSKQKPSLNKSLNKVDTIDTAALQKFLYYRDRLKTFNAKMKRKDNFFPRTTNTTAKCYICGLTNKVDSYKIPLQPECERSLNAIDIRFMASREDKMFTCIQADKEASINATIQSSSIRGGCYRRFVDISSIFDERGCRRSPPELGHSHASTRFASLEKMLHNVTEGCVVSPIATLTKFSKSISLFAQYHVCVCMGDFCNSALTHLNVMDFMMAYLVGTLYVLY